MLLTRVFLQSISVLSEVCHPNLELSSASRNRRCPTISRAAKNEVNQKLERVIDCEARFTDSRLTMCYKNR